MYNSKILKVKLYILIFFVAGIGLKSKAQNQELDTAYKLWNNLLQKHVSDNGFVEYRNFKKDEAKLEKVTSSLSDNSPDKNWNKNEKMAYLINLYNAYTIKLVLKNLPLESIKDIGDKPFDAFKMKFIELDGEMVSLDDIEKKMLLSLGDPRVHFAVNCVSFSCPRLDNKAYMPEDLNKHLDSAAHRFINSELNIITSNKVKLSKIFDWYKNDFNRKNQNVIDFINSYAEIKIKKGSEVEYLDYDWKLNSL